jgi:hypothetical protein
MARRQCKGWQRKGNNCEGYPGFRARLQTRALRTEEELQRLAPERQLFCALLSVTHTTTPPNLLRASSFHGQFPFLPIPTAVYRCLYAQPAPCAMRLPASSVAL